MRYLMTVVGTVLLLLLVSCAPSAQQDKINRNQAEVHYKLALAHLQSNNPTQALKELLIAVEENPRSSAIHVALAQAYHQKKAYQLAEQHYLEALQLSPDEPRYQNNLAALYLDMEQWDKAIDYFERAANNLLFTSPQIALSGAGYAYSKLGQYQKALALFARAIELEPNYAPGYFHQSQVFRALNQQDQERAALEQAVELSPNFVRARYQLGLVLQEQGHYSEAAEQLKRIHELAPGSEWDRKGQQLRQTFPQNEPESNASPG